MEQILNEIRLLFDKKIESINIDYKIYNMSLKEKVLYFLLAALVIFLISFIFYRNLVISIVFSLFALLYPKQKIPTLIKMRQNELNLQFKDMLYSVSSSITAGSSIETAFKDAKKDLLLQYPEYNTYILKELDIIISKIDMNEPLEKALIDFGERSGIEDIINFALVFNTCKRTGGNMVEVIKNTTSIIGDKIEIKQEIDILLTQRKFEQKILSVMPICLVIMLSFGAPDYMDPVFNTLQGRFAVTICLILLGLSFFISNKIMDIKI